MHLCVLSCVWLLANPWPAARQAPLLMEFSRQEYWSGFPFHSPGDCLNPGTEPRVSCFLHCQADSLPLVPPGNWVLHGSLKYSLLWIEHQPGGEETTEAQLWVSDGLNVPLFSPKCCQAYPPSTMPTAGNVRQGGNRKREGKGSRYRLQNSFQFKFHIFYLKVRDRKLMKDCLNYLVKLKLYRHTVEMFAYLFWYI